MKILFIQSIHPKNLYALLYYNICTRTIQPEQLDQIDLNEFNVVISPSTPIQVKDYPNIKFLFGPHFSVVPDERFQQIIGPHSAYNSLSDWVVRMFSTFEITKNVRFVTVPFGVDTDRFCEANPISQRHKVMVYFKHRDPKELAQLDTFLKNKQIHAQLFHYGHYKEEDYLRQLQQTRYGIWLGCHESQGFALQEALSCNIPLLVWNVSSMKQEYGQQYEDYAATSISYWDDTCGHVFYTFDQLEEAYSVFIESLESYKPRQFILNHLSMEQCKHKLLKTLEEL